MKPARSLASRAPWWLRPLFSRGRFSPRLLLAWQAFYVACYLAWKYVNTAPQVLNGVLVPAPNVVELCGLFLGAVTVLLGLGTLQTVKLGDAPVDSPPSEPATDESQTAAPPSDQEARPGQTTTS